MSTWIIVSQAFYIQPSIFQLTLFRRRAAGHQVMRDKLEKRVFWITLGRSQHKSSAFLSVQHGKQGRPEPPNLKENKLRMYRSHGKSGKEWSLQLREESYQLQGRNSTYEEKDRINLVDLFRGKDYRCVISVPFCKWLQNSYFDMLLHPFLSSKCPVIYCNCRKRQFFCVPKSKEGNLGFV